MKKLIAISVVFALAAGVAFAADVSGTVSAIVNPIDTTLVKDQDATVTATGELKLVRLTGAGESGDGKFGGEIRIQLEDAAFVARVAPDYDGDSQIEGKPFFVLNSAWAWWKPIDQFKLILGGNDDGLWGKEGVTGWSFNQVANDNGATNFGIWYGPYWGSGSVYGAKLKPIHNRYTFFEGFNAWGAALEIRPIDALGINIAIPFIKGNGGTGPGEAKDVYKALVAQVDLNLPFGNIALTYDGGGRSVLAMASGDLPADDGALFLYFGGSFGDLSLDVGFSFHFAENWNSMPPVGIGLGLKYAAGAFGIKFRTTLALGGDDKTTYVNTSINPYFAINDNMCVFLNAGIGIVAPENTDALVGFYVNPYLRVGGEWGPSFYVGLKFETTGVAVKDPAIHFSIPIALTVGF